jgi:hypothetical protein
MSCGFAIAPQFCPLNGSRIFPIPRNGASKALPPQPIRMVRRRNHTSRKIGKAVLK